jgi:hypothetical protein
MAEANFSWFKLASFVGATILLALAFVSIGTGIGMITDGEAFRGIVGIIDGLLCGAGAVIVYKNYQRKTGY